MTDNDSPTDLLMKQAIPSLTLEPATAAELPAIYRLLQAAELPTEDLTDRVYLLVARDAAQEVVGCGGLEVFSSVALLRSLAVAPQYQGFSLGRQLVARLLEDAATRQISSLFLLTTTAPGFFEKQGFNRIDRSATPDIIRQTTEFSQLCPSSAIVMRKELTAG